MFFFTQTRRVQQRTITTNEANTLPLHILHSIILIGLIFFPPTCLKDLKVSYEGHVASSDKM